MGILQSHFQGGLPSAILFDLDGTLVDSAPDLAVALDQTLNELDLEPVGEARVRNWVGNGARTLVQRALAHVHNANEKDISAENIESTLALFLARYQQINGKYSRLYPGVESALDYWRGQQIEMAVVTNKLREFVPKLLSQLGIDGYFQVLVGGECVAQRKPSPMMLYHACDQLGVDPGHCLMVGDSRHDIGAAKAAAIPVAAVNYGYNHGEAVALSKPDWVVSSFIDLL